MGAKDSVLLSYSITEIDQDNTALRWKCPLLQDFPATPDDVRKVTFTKRAHITEGGKLHPIAGKIVNETPDGPRSYYVDQSLWSEYEKMCVKTIQAEEKEQDPTDDTPPLKIIKDLFLHAFYPIDCVEVRKLSEKEKKDFTTQVTEYRKRSPKRNMFLERQR